jgi:hypothetical protein
VSSHGSGVLGTWPVGEVVGERAATIATASPSATRSVMSARCPNGLRPRYVFAERPSTGDWTASGTFLL